MITYKRLVLYLFLVVSVLQLSGNNFIRKSEFPVDYKADTALLKNNMQAIIDFGYRYYQNPDALNKTADFIKAKFLELSDSVTEQKYLVNGVAYKNIICSFNTDKKNRLIIGAHYDVCGEQDGADDNAAAVVGMLRLAQLLKNEQLDYRIDFVAFTLEEPPFYRTDSMGSHIHATYLKENNIPVLGMINLESIGYFSDKKHSQTYSRKIHNLTYGTVGNFILVVRRDDGSFVRQVTKRMKESGLISTKSIKGLKRLKGVDQSDHRNYWKYGYPAVMITNTAYYRNKNYHRKSDTVDTIDFSRLSAVIHQLHYTISKLEF
ncbi:MAG: M28 family peptidase [Paludibacteraceae bacterium]